MPGAQQFGDMFGLPEGKRAFSGGDAERLHPAIIAERGGRRVQRWRIASRSSVRQRRLTSKGRSTPCRIACA